MQRLFSTSRKGTGTVEAAIKINYQKLRTETILGTGTVEAAIKVNYQKLRTETILDIESKNILKS
jgi:hypothetical protein